MNIDDPFEIQAVIARFANSSHVKDWSGHQSCFTQSLHADYSDLRGTPPQTAKAAEYVGARRKALDHLKLIKTQSGRSAASRKRFFGTKGFRPFAKAQNELSRMRRTR